MYTFSSMKYAAVLLPALAIGMPIASASEKNCECPPEDQRTTAKMGSERTDHNADKSKVSREKLFSDEYGGQTLSNQAKPSQRNHPAYVDRTPVRGYYANKLVGAKIMNRNNNEAIGEVTNLVMDESGQIVAAIVSVDRVMGIGERDVAIAWDEIEREADGDDVTLTVYMTQKGLDDTPRYSSGRNISRK